MINDKRKEQGLSPLDVVVIDITLAEDKKGISSTRIRNGEISRKGKVYIKEEWLRNQLLLPMNLRDELRKPFGIIIQELPEEIHGERTITIGDVTTQKFNLRNLGQILSIVDYQVKRHKLYEKITDLGFSSDIVIDEVVNEAATISPQLFRSIINAINEKKKSVILVKGEEDLAVIPAVLAAPLGFKIYYGQPDEGLVEVAVNPETKEKAFELLRRFSS
jgi:GTP-dependent dephospho-CoA kinase